MDFKIGDKVRSKTNHNIIGIVREVDIHDWCGTVKQIVTISDIFSNDIISIDARDIEKVDEEKETKEMTSYKVGDIVEHPLYNESIIIDDNSTSRFESGHIEIVPLTGLSRGLPVLVSIDKIKHGDNKLMISIEDYNKMANTIENLKKENIRLKEDAITIVHEKWNLKKEKADLQERLYLANDKAKCAETILAINTPRSNKLPEVKSVLYHKPATIIFWKDGTKTVVKTQNKEKYDKEKGFVMAYLKKILDNEGNYYEEIKRWTDIR